MSLMQHFAITFFVVNSIAFVVAAKLLFRSDAAKTPAYLFMATFLGLLGLTIWHLYQFPTASQPRLATSVVLCAMSLALFWWAALAIKSRPFTVIFSPDAPQYLNRSGPYRWVRHPFYSAYLMNFSAAALSTSHIVPSAILVVIFVIYCIGATNEEGKFDRSPFEADYKKYRTEAGMFFPRLIRGNRP